MGSTVAAPRSALGRVASISRGERGLVAPEPALHNHQEIAAATCRCAGDAGATLSRKMSCGGRNPDRSLSDQELTIDWHLHGRGEIVCLGRHANDSKQMYVLRVGHSLLFRRRRMRMNAIGTAVRG